MRITDKITSVKNTRIKNFQHLQKARERKEQNVFIIEGIKEIEKVVKSGYRFKSVYFCPAIISSEAVLALIPSATDFFETSKEVYDKIAYRENSGGIVALVTPRSHQLNELQLPKTPLILVLESVEKPGNLGALLRTADAAGVDAVIVCDPQTDVYNPNAIRSSIGCVFTVPIAVSDSQETITWLQENNVNIYCTYLQAAKPYHQTDFTLSSAIVMGTEATGITKQWVDAATHNIIIPMQGAADSLNVSTAAAVVIFEACRQRGFDKGQ